MPSAAQVEAFRQTHFDAGAMKAAVRRKIFDLLDRQLEASVEDAEDRAVIRRDFEAEVAFLEDASIRSFKGVFLSPNRSEKRER